MVTSLRRLSRPGPAPAGGAGGRHPPRPVVLPPGYDEAFYLFYGRYPNLSYLDHPVGVGFGL